MNEDKPRICGRDLQIVRRERVDWEPFFVVDDEGAAVIEKKLHAPLAFGLNIQDIITPWEVLLME